MFAKRLGSRLGYFARNLLLVLAVAVLLLGPACNGQNLPADSPPPATAVTEGAPAEPSPAGPPTLQEMAGEVAADVGQVMTVVEGDPQRVIFLFEERHDSRLGQVEIAIMLNRLYRDYGMRHIGLEGQPAQKGPLDLTWAHEQPYYQPDQPISSREDVIVQTLQDGEISAVEAIGLIYYDVVVDGIDDAGLYAFEIGDSAHSVHIYYLLNIAWAGMSNVERTAYMSLYNDKKYDEAMEFALSTDEWTAEMWGRLSNTVDIASAEEWLEALDAMKARAAEVNAVLDDQAAADLASLREYIQTVSQRSDIMAANMLALTQAYPGAPLAMNAGAMHTARLVELLTQGGASLVVLRPQSLAEGSTLGLLSPEAYNRKAAGLSVDPDGWLGSFLDGRRKPEPVADTVAYKQNCIVRERAQQLVKSAVDLFNQGYSAEEVQEILNRTFEKDTIKAINREYGITAVKVNKVIRNEAGIAVDFTITFEDGRQLNGVGARLRGASAKQAISLEDRLQGSRAALQQKPVETPPTQPGGATPQQVCSDTAVEWTKSGG